MEVKNYDSTTSRLKECPFCGSAPTWHLIGNAYYQTIRKPVKVVVKCSNPLCGATITKGSMSIERAENYAIEAWNKRVDNNKF